MSYDEWLRRKYAEWRKKKQEKKKQEQELADSTDPEEQKVRAFTRTMRATFENCDVAIKVFV